MKMRRALYALLLMLAVSAASAFGQTPDLVLRGEIQRAHHESYRELSFRVPSGVRAIEITLQYARGQGVTIDLGVIDPESLRGWSGGAKDRIIIAETSATPSYRPGPIQAGRWRLLLGIPHAREGVAIKYEARIQFHRDDEPPFAPEPLSDGAGWYRGDLHAHTGHSDGTCAAPSGARAPCPLVRTLDAALTRELDFIAITDHNTTSQFNEMRALQAAYDSLLLLPGRELTTFQGHANVIGTMRPFDFRVSGTRTMNDVLRDAGEAFVSINHPASPGGESCMGCAWTAETDYARIDAIEVTNGGLAGALTQSAEGPFSGIAFWHARLNEGHRLIAIGGSDNHDPMMAPARFGAVGKPTTVVSSIALSQRDILQGLQEGRAFIDVDGNCRCILTLQAEISTSAGLAIATMGEAMSAEAGARAAFSIVSSFSQDRAGFEFIVDGVVAPADEPNGRTLTWISDGERHWVRANVRDANGRLVLIGNPIFVNW